MPEKPWFALKRRQLAERLDIVTTTVNKHKGNRQRAANELGIKESWLRELVNTYELPVPPAPTRGRPRKGM